MAASAGVGGPAEREGDEQDDDRLQQFDADDRGGLGGDQAGPGQGRGAQALEHPVPALEPGGDRLAGERGRHDREGDDAGGQEVDPGVAAAEVDQRLQAERGEQQQRDDERERELLAVAQQLPRLLGRLRGDHPVRRGGARRGGPGPRGGLAGDGRSRQPLRSLPVSSRKMSSSVRDSICRLLGSTPRSAHQAVTAASKAGWTAPPGTSIR